MRVLLFSKAAIRAVYHRQYEYIAAHPAIDELLVAVPPYWQEPRVGRIPLEGITPHGYRLEVTPLRWNGHYHLYYAPHLPRLMRQFRPDLVHIDEEVYNFATFHAAMMARRIGAHSVAFCWQNIYRRYPPPFRWFEIALARRLSGVVAGNADALQVLRRKGFSLPMTVIPQYGVDTEVFSPGIPPTPPPFRVGYVGRLVPAKGIDTLLESLRHCPDDCELWVAGEGDETRWKALAESLGIANRVHWLGAVPSRHVADFLRHLHVLVLPSRTTPRWKEQFGRVLVEAMACGVPVVGSNSGEIPRVIGDAGVVFPEGDAQHLAQHIVLLKQHPEEWTDLSRKARERAVQQFSMAQVASRYIEFWCSLPLR
ncbi:MAG: glycosyltransferase [Armatimonadota bacterium]